MHCFYINLDSKTDRRETIEKNFLDNTDGSWELKRFPAIDVSYVRKHSLPGNLRETEKACFSSHKTVISDSRYATDHVLIMEDDSCLGKETQNTIKSIVKDNSSGWDIMYGEVCVPEPENMCRLIRLKNDLKGGTTFLDLSKMNYAGATAYVINKNSILKIYNLLQKVRSYDVPFDLLLRQYVHTGQLKAFVPFPFITSFAENALNSDIREKMELSTDLVWILFRKLMWTDAVIAKEQKHLDFIKQNLVTEDSEAYATILSACLSNKLMVK